MSDTQPTRSEWSSRGEFRPEPDKQRRESDAMLDRVNRSESETAEVYRRIEDQLRGVARRLDASERSQAESNRVVSKAAVEMNIAAREQAQAFDQLTANVTNIAERLEHVESRDPGDGLRDAVKALHQGLSRLADQISQTANQSATQVSALADNLENVAGRIGQARQEAVAATQALESRVAVLDERVRAVESAAQNTAGTLGRALEAIESQRRNVTPADTIQRLEASVHRLEERSATPDETIQRLEQSVHRLEERGIDPSMDRRLSGIERTLADVVDRIESHDDSRGVEDSLRKIVLRLDSLETAQREAAAELRAAAEQQKTVRAAQVEELPPAAPAYVPPVAAPAPPPAQNAPFGALPPFEAPPYPEAPPSYAAVPPRQPAAAFADTLPPFANGFEAQPAAPAFAAPGFNPESNGAASPTVESYLAAARRSARVAAQQETDKASIGAMRWGTPAAAKPETPEKRTRPVLVGLVALIGIAVIAAVVLVRQANVLHPQAAPATEIAKPDLKVVPATTLHATPEETPTLTPAPGAPVVMKPHADATQPALPVAAKPAPVTPAPQAQSAARPASNAPLDRLTAAANAGNAKAQLIVGLKYLDGDGVAANDAEAAKWISRAAAAGEAVAEYRLGTLYERGRGVPADAAKAVHWYQAAANMGSRKAMHNLAVAYAEGSGVKRDYIEASRWFLRAANLGLSDSQFNLAVLYERGLGVPQNLVDAYKWYAIAAAQGDTESKSRIGVIASQLDNDARAAAQHAADTFRPGQLDARANVAPTMADATRGG